MRVGDQNRASARSSEIGSSLCARYDSPTGVFGAVKTLSTSGDPFVWNHLKLWGVMIGIVTLVQIAAPILVPRSYSLTLINDVFDLILLLSAVCVFLANVNASPRQTRVFWTLLATCWGIRIVGQALWITAVRLTDRGVVASNSCAIS